MPDSLGITTRCPLIEESPTLNQIFTIDPAPNFQVDERVTVQHLPAIAHQHPNLQSISFNDGSGLLGKNIAHIMSHFPQLHHLQISNMNSEQAAAAVRMLWLIGQQYRDLETVTLNDMEWSLDC